MKLKNTYREVIRSRPLLPSPNTPVRLLVLAAAVTACAPAHPENATGLPHAFDAGWQGEKTCELLYETESVRVGHCSFPPGIGHEKHYHNPHFGYVLAGGKLRITSADGEVTEVQTTTGGSWSSDEITVHEALNIGETTTDYLIVEPRAQ
jgi:quercetin dioxygenase-like cupin family protein